MASIVRRAGSSNTFTVGGDSRTDFKSIQAAIDAAVAAGADSENPWVIIVSPGIYDEAITVAPGVRVVAQAANTVLLEKNLIVQTGGVIDGCILAATKTITHRNHVYTAQNPGQLADDIAPVGTRTYDIYLGSSFSQAFKAATFHWSPDGIRFRHLMNFGWRHVDPDTDTANNYMARDPSIAFWRGRYIVAYGCYEPNSVNEQYRRFGLARIATDFSGVEYVRTEACTPPNGLCNWAPDLYVHEADDTLHAYVSVNRTAENGHIAIFHGVTDQTDLTGWAWDETPIKTVAYDGNACMHNGVLYFAYTSDYNLYIGKLENDGVPNPAGPFVAFNPVRTISKNTVGEMEGPCLVPMPDGTMRCYFDCTTPLAQGACQNWYYIPSSNAFADLGAPVRVQLCSTPRHGTVIRRTVGHAEYQQLIALGASANPIVMANTNVATSAPPTADQLASTLGSPFLLPEGTLALVRDANGVSVLCVVGMNYTNNTKTWKYVNLGNTS